jgi:EAL domain-containing protein (putative c-di-GMP-specific phosphodiesterase class I)
VLSAGRFKLYAQLVVPLDGSDKIHAEFLVRMVDKTGEIWPPSKFLPVAERFGIAPRFDRWVFERSLNLLREWGPDAPNLGHVSINLSGQTLMDAATLEWIEARYRQAQLAPGAVCFEITEMAAIDSWSVASSYIDRLRGLGALFSLDDFGAGFSSFSYLESVPTDYLKIDGSFVRQCLAQPRQLELVRTLNEIGHLFGKKTVAEFVENDELLAVIRGMGVDCAQGYFTGTPSPAEDLLDVIAVWRARKP